MRSMINITFKLQYTEAWKSVKYTGNVEEIGIDKRLEMKIIT